MQENKMKIVPVSYIEAAEEVLQKAPCDCSHGMRYDRGDHLSSCPLFDLNIASIELSSAPDVQQEPIFDLAKGLNYIADNGFWPQVIFDDNGYWAIQDEGGANIRMDEDQDYQLSTVIPAHSFKPTLKEAWGEYMRKLKEHGNDLDFNCAFTASQPPNDSELLQKQLDMAGKSEPVERVEELEKEAAWIRNKLKLPADTKLLSGDVTLAGTMHKMVGHAKGYQTYIEAYKCDDKQGEIARLTVRTTEIEAENNRLRIALTELEEAARMVMSGEMAVSSIMVERMKAQDALQSIRDMKVGKV